MNENKKTRNISWEKSDNHGVNDSHLNAQVDVGTVENQISLSKHNDTPVMVVNHNNRLGRNFSQDIRNKLINGRYIDLSKTSNYNGHWWLLNYKLYWKILEINRI